MSIAKSASGVEELKAWLREWPGVRENVRHLINDHGRRDPSIHFELRLAELELQDLDEAVRRISALGRLLSQGSELTQAELEATGNR